VVQNRKGQKKAEGKVAYAHRQSITERTWGAERKSLSMQGRRISGASRKKKSVSPTNKKAKGGKGTYPFGQEGGGIRMCVCQLVLRSGRK